MGFFAKFIKPKVDDKKLSDLILSMKTWFAPLDKNFNLDEKNLENFARDIILLENNYNFSSREWECCINILELFIDHFKAGVFINKLIPVEIIFAYEVRVFLKSNKFTKLNHLGYYGYTCNVLRLIFSGRNLEHIIRGRKLDRYNHKSNSGARIKLNYSLNDIKKIMLHYTYLVKFFSKHFEFDIVGNDIIKTFSNSSYSPVRISDSVKKLLKLKQFEFNLEFTDVFMDSNICGVDLFPEGEFCITLKYKNKLSYFICFDVVDCDEILIKQVQGVEGGSLRGGEYPLILIKLVETFVKFIGFSLVSIVGSNSGYLRPYSGVHYYEYSLQIKVEKKYDFWAKKLDYILNLKDKIWYKRI